jgi:hypothetical protein
MLKDRKSGGSAVMRYTTIVAILAVAVFAACVTGPDNDEAGPPWSPVDSSWKVIENLEYAYNNMNLDLYMSCFRSDFEFHLLEVNWQNYGFDESACQCSTWWGYDLEQQFHESMFNQAYGIDLVLSGTSQVPWSGDSTGESLQLYRVFDLKVYTVETLEDGYRASGGAIFICRQDADGEWYIWQWWDQSET